MNRSTRILEIRPAVPKAKIKPQCSVQEHFQNTTLRPILKLQNDLLIATFKNYITKRKNIYYQLTLEKRLIYITNAIQKDSNYNLQLKGIIIGQFTLEEYQAYSQDSSALNKRIISMIIKRLQDQIQLFEPALV